MALCPRVPHFFYYLQGICVPSNNIVVNQKLPDNRCNNLVGFINYFFFASTGNITI